jgi:hypothetical protein
MATKEEETLARHSVVNGSTPQPHIEQVVSDTTPSEPSTEIVDVKPSEIQEESPVEIDHALDPLAPPHIVLREVAAALDRARFEARTCRAATAEARANFARCLGAWNASGPAPMTQAALMKEHILSNQRERERKAAAGQLRRPATVSETARAYAGGGHNVRRGHGRAYAHGAHSKAEALELNARRIAAANAAFKLPSER